MKELYDEYQEAEHCGWMTIIFATYERQVMAQQAHATY